MSKGKYGIVEISPAELKRQEEERKRRLEEERLRLEEARKAEIERRRKEEIAAEKERIALARRFREKAPGFSQPTRPKIKSHQPEREKPDTSIEMREQVKAMKEQLAAFPDLWIEYFADRLQVIKEVIQRVEKGGFDPYHYHQLKEAGRNLMILSGTAEKELEGIFCRVKELKDECEKTLIDMEVVSDNAPLDEQRRRARTIISALNSLLHESRPDAINSRLEELRPDSKRLWEEYLLSRESAQIRQYLMQNAREVLEQMGYRTLRMDMTAAGNAIYEADNLLYFRTPGKGLVELSLSADQTFAANYVLPKRAAENAAEISEEEILTDCHRWCRDYDNFIWQLSLRSIYMQEKGYIAAEEGHFKEVTVPKDFFEEEELPDYRRKENEKRRML